MEHELHPYETWVGIQHGASLVNGATFKSLVLGPPYKAMCRYGVYYVRMGPEKQ